jgi:hypothetical protein
MNPISILGLETRGFLYLLAALLAYRLLTRQINLNGLLSRKGETTAVSPERVQLLLATLALSAKFLGDVAHTTNGKMPDITPQWLLIFGGSSGIYASIKAITMLKIKKISTGSMK